jgi:hypothetical protein
VLVGAIVGCGLARVWLVLVVAHLDASPAAPALAFAALGVFGLLPLGPSAPPGALLAVSGGAGAGALAAGLALSATSIAAVAVYGVVLAVAGRRASRAASPRARAALCGQGTEGEGAPSPARVPGARSSRTIRVRFATPCARPRGGGPD